MWLVHTDDSVFYICSVASSLLCKHIVLAAAENGEQISLSWHLCAAFAHEARFRLRHPAVAHKNRFSARFFDQVLGAEMYDNFHAEFSCCMVYTMRMKRELPLHDFFVVNIGSGEKVLRRLT